MYGTGSQVKITDTDNMRIEADQANNTVRKKCLI